MAPRNPKSIAEQITACEAVLDSVAVWTWPRNDLDELKLSPKWREHLVENDTQITHSEQLNKDLMPFAVKFSSRYWADER